MKLGKMDNEERVKEKRKWVWGGGGGIFCLGLSIWNENGCPSNFLVSKYTEKCIKKAYFTWQKVEGSILQDFWHEVQFAAPAHPLVSHFQTLECSILW